MKQRYFRNFSKRYHHDDQLLLSWQKVSEVIIFYHQSEKYTNSIDSSVDQHMNIIMSTSSVEVFLKKQTDHDIGGHDIPWLSQFLCLDTISLSHNLCSYDFGLKTKLLLSIDVRFIATFQVFKHSIPERFLNDIGKHPGMLEVERMLVAKENGQLTFQAKKLVD